MQLWVPFFSFVQFILGVRIVLSGSVVLNAYLRCQTFFNMRVKQLRLAAVRREKLEREKRERDAQPEK
jgi:hypothetical protein